MTRKIAMANREVVALCALLSSCSAPSPGEPADSDSAAPSARGARSASDGPVTSPEVADPLQGDENPAPEARESLADSQNREGPPVLERVPDPELPIESEPDSEVTPVVEPEREAESGSEAFQPVIPAVSGDCPTWRSSTITLMGLSGIQVVAGAKSPEPTAPMVFYWHGTGGTSGEFGLMAGAVSQAVQAEGGIVVSFQGTTGGDLLSGTSTFGRGDMALVDQLTACAVRDHNVDPRRIFTTGCSAGGLFATALAVLRSDYIAAAAPNSGGLIFGQPFQGSYTPALMTMHGAPGRDVVIVDFSDTSRTADQSFKSRGGFVINCNHGGGHCGAAALAPDVWDFFLAHPYGVEPAPSPWASGLPAGFGRSCSLF